MRNLLVSRSQLLFLGISIFITSISAFAPVNNTEETKADVQNQPKTQIDEPNVQEVKPTVPVPKEEVMVEATAEYKIETEKEEVTVTGEILDEQLKGNLQGLGEEFVEAGKEHEIDPVFLVALAAQETGWGNSDLSNKPWNNVGGITCAPELYEEIFGETYPNPGCGQIVSGGTEWQKFASVEDSISFKAAYLKRQYLESGRETITEIQEKYAPNEADNDKHGLNNYWVKNIVSIMNEINEEIFA